VQLLLWLNRPNEAERLCLQLERHLVGLEPVRQQEAFTALLLAQARLGLCEGRSEHVQALLENHLDGSAVPQPFERRLRVSLLLAVAQWQRNQDEKAFALLEAQLEEGWRRGYRRVFLDDALWLLPLLRVWLERHPDRALRWRPLLEALRAQFLQLGIDPDAFREHRDVSHREREILRFVAAGLSNRDIAQVVHLSEATVKWHLHNLFAKLDVRSRTQAVLAGKRLGLLHEA
jgi:LuxR family maltose regulon positive regulatory protein